MSTRSDRDARRGERGSVASDCFEVDTRALSALRILAGLLVVAYAGFLASDDRARAYFSDEGLFPRSALEAVFPAHHDATLLRFVGSHEGARAALAGLAGLGVLLSLGLFTPVVAPLVVVALAQLHLRAVPVVNASMVTMHLVGIPFAVLPIARHASLDALLGARLGWSRPAARIATLAPFVLRVQLAAIYLFNAIQKDGATWRHGHAVHYVLYSSRATWPYVASLRADEPGWFSPLLTYGALVLEVALPLALLVPFRRTLLRRLAVVAMVLLHGGICLLADLGPFPFVFGFAALFVLASEPWPRDAAPVSVERPRGLAWLREAFLAFHLVVLVAQLWPGNAAARVLLGPAPSLAWTEPYTRPLYLAQAWSMFAPEAPTRDLLWVPVVVVTGERYVDPERGGSPDFRGLDQRAAPVDAFRQIAESHLLGYSWADVGAPILSYFHRRAIREGYVRAEEVQRIELHVLEMDRPPPGSTAPSITRSRVAFMQTVRPVAGPVVPGP